MILTGPRESAGYFKQVDDFIRLTLGAEACNLYQIIIGNPEKVAKSMIREIKKVRAYRIQNNDAFYFNWLLKINQGFQIPFVPSHGNMASLEIDRSLPTHKLAANLRRLFSGIVAGNVKPEGLKAVRNHGQYIIDGDPDIMIAMDELLRGFIADGRMKLPGGNSYTPCYKVKIR